MNFALLLLGQWVLYLLLLLLDDYTGLLLAVIIGAICFACWAVARVVEMIQPSRVESWVYSLMLSGWVAPALALLLFVALRGGIDWG